MKKLLFVTLALFGLAFGSQAAEAKECSELKEIKLTAWGVDTGTLPYVVGMQQGLFAKNCVDFKPLVLDTVPDMTDLLKSDPSLDGTIVVEPAVALMLYADQGSWSGEVPQLAGASAGNIYLLVSKKPLNEMAGEVMATRRCSDIDDKDGSAWRDVTNPENETYQVVQPGINTIANLRLFRQAAGKDLPENLRILCGTLFSSGKKPNLGDNPVVYLEEGHGATRRKELLLDDTSGVVGASLWLEHYFSIRDKVPGLIVYDSEPGIIELPMNGVYAFPSKIEAKREAFCGTVKSLQEANALLLAGQASFENGVASFDAEALKAFEIFETAVKSDLPGIPNGLMDALTAQPKSSSETAEETVANTTKLRQEIFVYLRNNVWKADPTPTSTQIDDFFHYYKINPEKKSGFYNNTCA